MTEQAPVMADTLTFLQERFGDAVRPDDREGYSGLIVNPDKLVAVATAVRDDLGFDYLANAVAVDYLGKGDFFEMVYHTYKTEEGGAGLVLQRADPARRGDAAESGPGLAGR